MLLFRSKCAREGSAISAVAGGLLSPPPSAPVPSSPPPPRRAAAAVVVAATASRAAVLGVFFDVGDLPYSVHPAVGIHAVALGLASAIVNALLVLLVLLLLLPLPRHLSLGSVPQPAASGTGGVVAR